LTIGFMEVIRFVEAIMIFYGLLANITIHPSRRDRI